jgi:hypothetical protein
MAGTPKQKRRDKRGAVRTGAQNKKRAGESRPAGLGD